MKKVFYLITVFFILVFFSCSNMVQDYQGDLSGTKTGLVSNSFFINNNSEFIYTPFSTLNINVKSGTQIRFKNGNGIWSTWYSYSAVYHPWYLGNALTGEKIVQTEILDSDSIIHTLSDTIIYIDKIKSPALLDNIGFGVSVASSSDAQTVISGVKEGNGYAGVCSWNGVSNEWECTSLERGDGLANDRYGFSVAISSDGNTAAAGAYWNNRVYVFAKESSVWLLKKIIQPFDPEVSGAFGYSLSISTGGTVLIVGAQGVSDSKGAAYIFEKNRGGSNAWGQRAKITASDGASYDKFGFSVAINTDGSKVASGAIWNDGRRGAVYVYSWDGAAYNQNQKLTDNEGAINDFFGSSLTMTSDGNYIASGSPFDDIINLGDNKGSLTVFQWSGGTYQKLQKIISSDGNNNDSFGNSVSLSSNGNLLLIGSVQADITGKGGIGSAYLMELSGGSYLLKNKLLPLDGQAEDQFGWGVTLSGNGTKAFCGSVFNDVNSASDNKGSIYVFPTD